MDKIKKVELQALDQTHKVAPTTDQELDETELDIVTGGSMLSDVKANVVKSIV